MRQKFITMLVIVLVLFILYLIMKIRTNRLRRRMKDHSSRFRFH
ncbi:MAG TPA: hypothetical protein PLP69_01220 [Bacteroidales bacterium]|nr:hypothetical protein [Bacteroidales bacterium]